MPGADGCPGCRALAGATAAVTRQKRQDLLVRMPRERTREAKTSSRLIRFSLVSVPGLGSQNGLLFRVRVPDGEAFLRENGAETLNSASAAPP